jgi:hypothetical protein
MRADPMGWVVWRDPVGLVTTTPGATRSVRSVFSVKPRGHAPYLLASCMDRNQVVALDLFTTVLQKGVKWTSLPINGTPDHPEMRHLLKRFKRLRIYGTGTLDPAGGGTLTFNTDNGAIVQSFPVFTYMGYPQRGILIEHCPGVNLVGRNVSVELDLNGTGLELTHLQVEWVNLI